jgi:HPt (histidine-containing phosphotransfer) domain-containing protein
VVAKLEESLDAEDFDAAARHAHTLKGASANITAVGLSRAAETVELICRKQDMHAAKASLGAMKARFTEFSRSLPVFRQQLEDHCQ